MKHIQTFRLFEDTLNEGLRFNAKGISFAEGEQELSVAIAEVGELIKTLEAGKTPAGKLLVVMPPKNWKAPAVLKTLKDFADTLYDWNKEFDVKSVKGFGNEEIIPLW